jgi:hypothetical protein
MQFTLVAREDNVILTRQLKRGKEDENNQLSNNDLYFVFPGLHSNDQASSTKSNGYAAFNP